MPPGVLILVILLIAVWMLLVRPQRRRQQDQLRMLDDLAVGDEVVTAGGLYGTITELEDDSVRLEIAPELTVRVAKRAIAAVLPPELEEAEAVDGEGEPEAAELEGQETSARVP